VYDNFVRGTAENLATALRDDRVKVFEAGGDICQTDILDAALKGADGVFHFAALWLLQCTSIHARRSKSTSAAPSTYSSLHSERCRPARLLVVGVRVRRCGRRADDEEHPFNFANFYGATRCRARRWRGHSTLATGSTTSACAT